MRNLALFTIILLGILSRFIPHAANMTALTAVALFAGTYVRPAKWAFIAPLGVMLVTDLVIGFHNLMFFVYGAWALIALLAILLRGKDDSSPTRVLGLSLSGSMIFFLVSNFGVWIVGDFYAKTWDGFVTCFVMALPFLQNQVVGDLVYVTAFFTVWHVLRSRIPQLAATKN